MSLPASYAVRLDRDVCRVSGPDAAGFLQGQLSQDVEALPVGESAFTFLLQPEGKLGFWLRITRPDDDTFVLDVDEGWGEGVQARLERFKLRVDAGVESLDWSAVAYRGDPSGDAVASTDDEVLRAAFAWPGLSGFDVLGRSVEVLDGFEEMAPADYEALRIAAGVPRMGAEITEGRIPAETGVVEMSVSFTKGCYTGQELVARIDSRGGNVPRNLRRMTIEGPPPDPGAEVAVDGEVVGELTSVAPAPGDGSGSVALAYVKRAVQVPASAVVGDRPARIESSSG